MGTLKLNNETTTVETTYNGWKNRATWNVALWVNNEPHLYFGMVEYCQIHANSRISWTGFVSWAGLNRASTPDGYSYTDSQLDYKALDSMLFEIYEGLAG